MNVFGFLSTIIICATVVAVTWFMFNKTLNIKITKTEEKPTVPAAEASREDDHAREKLEEEINKDRLISMDSVIKSANEMMGIETINPEEEVND